MSIAQQIREFEESVYRRPRGESVPSLIEILKELANEKSDLGFWTTAATDAEAVREVFTRLESAISTILMSPDLVVSNQ